LRVVVTGGSGFIGRRVVGVLADAGHEVTVVSRHGEASRAASGKDVGVDRRARYARGDVSSGDGLVEAMRGHDAVIHLVGIIAEKGRQTFAAVHVGGTSKVIEAAQQAGVRRYLHMSALGADPASRSGYARSKGEAEAVVRSSGLDYTIFRPSLVFGPGDDFFGRVLRNLVSQAPIVPVIGAGEFPFRPVWVGDVARAFLGALEDPSTAGKIFDVTGPREYTFRELLQLELKALGKRKPLVGVPIALMNAAVPLMNLLPNPPITRDQYAMLLAGNTADPEPARRALKLELRPLEGELPGILKGAPLH
jgi:uncharacterized protein YbjT (DUF2867 family)